MTTNSNAGYVPVRYIGRKPEWIDRLYGSGLYFTTDQVRSVPAEMARKFLRHADAFERAEASDAVETVKKADDSSTTDDTQKLLDQANKDKAEKEKDLTAVQDLHDQINAMDKDGLKAFAFSHYQQKLDMRKSVEDLRSAVHQSIDQFGVV